MLTLLVFRALRGTAWYWQTFGTMDELSVVHSGPKELSLFYQNLVPSRLVTFWDNKVQASQPRRWSPLPSRYSGEDDRSRGWLGSPRLTVLPRPREPPTL